MRYYGQLKQDQWVLHKTKAKTNGYFVEFGACDGITLSNTYLLEKAFGWSGIVAEPNPAYHRSLFNNRACHVSTLCVHTHTGQILSFLATATGELGCAEYVVNDDHHAAKRQQHTRINVNTISLFDLLHTYNAPPVIDYLSVDTEGSESDILAAFDFDAYDIKLITVEHNHVDAKRQKIYTVLTQNGYQRWPQNTSFDDWYVRAPFPE